MPYDIMFGHLPLKVHKRCTLEEDGISDEIFALNVTKNSKC